MTKHINFAYLQARDVKRNAIAHTEEIHVSQALRAISKHLGSGGKKTILDLGGASKANVSYFSNYSCTLIIDDFLNEYRRLKQSEPECSPARALESLVGDNGGWRFDAIFAWDILNYLNPVEAKSFLKALSDRSKADALLLAYVSSVTDIPEEPSSHHIIDHERISLLKRGAGTIKCARFSQRELMTYLPGWKLTRSIHLRSALQEHLFTFSGRPAGLPADCRSDASRSERSVHDDLVSA
ncbi:MAG: hypothetical protein IT290_13105 [Deltaproteobacteria bacterium]|nr:hypothetical protein [Deltaproteobacteria bacterium]